MPHNLGLGVCWRPCTGADCLIRVLEGKELLDERLRAELRSVKDEDLNQGMYIMCWSVAQLATDSASVVWMSCVWLCTCT
jgi:hypothetical protein